MKTLSSSFLILLGVMFRYQKRLDRTGDGAAGEERLSGELEYLCRKFWLQTNASGHLIRRGVSAASPDTAPAVCAENEENFIRELGVAKQDVLKIWVAEMQNWEKAEVSKILHVG